MDNWDRNSDCEKKKKTARLAGRRSEHGRGRARQNRERRARRGTTRRRAYGTPNGGSHLELLLYLIARLRLKTWRKIDLSVAHTTPHSSSYMSEVYDLFQILLCALSFVFYLFSSWESLPLESYWRLSCDHGLHCSHELMWAHVFLWRAIEYNTAQYSLQNWVWTIQSIVLTADVFQLLIL